MISFSSFSGEVPRFDPRLLPDTAAVLAMNTRMESGALEPMRQNWLVGSTDNFSQTIYRFQERWLSWGGIVDVAPAPVAEDRLYVTGDGAPKMIVGTNVYPLRLPSPAVALSATVSGQVDDQLSSVILYAYTWVTEMGEESEPSPLGTEVLWSPGLNVTVDGFGIPVGGRGITKMRIYRSQTSALGTTQLYFVHERDAVSTPWIDVVADNPIQEPIPSTDFNPPPDDLQGITAGPGGMMAAFRGKELYFSEPYQPHAWPEKYMLTTNYKIVALAWFDSSLAILTEGSPYVAQGLTPESMGMERIKVNLPCISAQGVVDLGYSVAYPSNEGLVLVSASSATVVTQGLFTKEQWYSLAPSTIIAGYYSSKYVMAHTRRGESSSEVMIIDLSSSTPFVLRTNHNAQAMFNEIGTGELYLLRDGFDIFQWDAPSQPYAVQTWRSKPFVLPAHMTFGVAMIECDNEPGPGEFVRVTITADDKTLVVEKVNRPVRLKSGFRALRWQITIESNMPVKTLRIGTGLNELTGG